jgi:hypothetical protein
MHTNASPVRKLDLRDDCSFRITVGNIEPAYAVGRFSDFAGVQNIVRAHGSDLPYLVISECAFHVPDNCFHTKLLPFVHREGERYRLRILCRVQNLHRGVRGSRLEIPKVLVRIQDTVLNSRGIEPAADHAQSYRSLLSQG